RTSVFEFLMALFLILVIIIIAFYSFSHFKLNNFQLANLKYLFLSWGVIFYALSGGSAVPEMKEVIGLNTNFFKKAIILGTIIPIILYLIFVISV
ncbi:aromatic amino acid transport family protein, partial [Escherichia coli]|uniref:aromatic amino acid transport family protein n=1 Tax=Escherichia coli TaxID=562 RepID=UPI00128EDE91